MNPAQLDATAALTRLSELLPEALALRDGDLYMACTRSFERLPERQGTWRKVALTDVGHFHWYAEPLLLVGLLWTTMRHAGADFALYSQGRTFTAQFRPHGSQEDAPSASADSEVLAVARAAVVYLEGRATPRGRV